MSPRIGYLLKKFPRLSETFVLGEILAQEALGADIHVFSRRGADDEPRHAELARLRAPIEVLPCDLDPWRELFQGTAATGELMQRIRVVHECFAPLALPRLSSLLGEAIWLLRRTRELGIEHVHAHFATDSAVVAMLLRALGGPSYSVTAHAKDIYRSTVSVEHLRVLLEHSAFVVTVCDANVAHIRRLVGERAARKLRRLYNGIDIESFAARRRAPVTGRVLSIGRLVEKKGFDVLVDALGLLRDRGVSFTAQLVGDGDDRQLIAQRIADRGLSGCVEMFGALPQSRVRELFDSAEVFALPCRIGVDGNRDALPTVLLEALAAGVPCVSTPVAGVSEILDGGRVGLLAPESDVSATARMLERLLGDAGLRRSFSSAGATRARELFDARIQAVALRAWFDESISQKELTCGSPA